MYHKFRKKCIAIILVLVTLLTMTDKVYAAGTEFPKLKEGQVVYDLEDLLTKKEEESLTEKIDKFRRQSNVNLIVVDVESFDFSKNSMVEYTEKLYHNAEKIKEIDIDTIVLCFSKNDDLFYIYGGKSMEDIFNTESIKKIKSNFMVEKDFRGYNKAIQKTLNEIALLLGESFEFGDEAEKNEGNAALNLVESLLKWCAVIVIVVIVVAIISAFFQGETNNTKEEIEGGIDAS